MSTISSTGATPAATGPTATLPANYSVPTTDLTSTQATSASFNSQTFLQLLVAQLQYQNPEDPTDPTQYLTQTAAFEEVEQLDNLQTAIQSLTSADESSAGVGLLGRQITANNPDGTGTLTGVVSSVSMSSSGPVLTVGNAQVPLSSVQSVTTPSAASSSSTSTAAGPSTASSPSTPSA